MTYKGAWKAVLIALEKSSASIDNENMGVQEKLIMKATIDGVIDRMNRIEKEIIEE